MRAGVRIGSEGARIAMAGDPGIDKYYDYSARIPQLRFYARCASHGFAEPSTVLLKRPKNAESVCFVADIAVISKSCRRPAELRIAIKGPAA